MKALPMITPFDKKHFRKPAFKDEKPLSGHYKFNAEMLVGIPKLEWNQLYNLEKVPKKDRR